MAATTIWIEFDGYWRDVNVGHVPAVSGVYVAYAAIYDANSRQVSLKRVLYIGESADVRARLETHERRPDWKHALRAGEVLCFSVGPVASGSRNRAEAALIYKHQPPLNTSCKDEFNYDSTTISLTGQTALLHTHFTVERTVRSAWR